MVVRGSLGKAIVEIDLDDKDFKNKTGQATAGLESNMKQLGGTIMGVVAALGLVAAAKETVSMLTTLTKKAIEVADSFEVMEKQLTTLTKSESKAKAFFGAIKDFAKETPYQVRDLAQSFNMLYPVFKDKTVPMMKLIGDTASGTGRSFEDTASAMMRMATGDWGVEIMRQLFLVKADFGDMFGPTGTLVASQEEAFDKLQEILGDRFGGMMVGMMDTVQGKVSNLKDVFDSLAASVGAELTPITKEFLDILIEVVKEIEEAGTLQEVARELAVELKNNKDVLADMAAALPDIIIALGEILRIAGDLVDELGDINEAWGEWTGTGKTAIQDLKEAMIEAGGVQAQYRALITGKSTEQAKREYVATVSGLRGHIYREGESLIEPERPKIKRAAGIGEAASDVEAYVAEMKAQGYSDADILFQARGTRIEAQVEMLVTPEERPSRAPGGAKKGKPTRRAGEEYLRAQPGYKPAWEMEMGYEVGGVEANLETTQETFDEMMDRYEEEQAKRQAKMLEQAEEIAGYLDPSRNIIEGLKSGDMRAAMENFAVNLGTRVSEELAHALFMKGVMAILNIISGGATAPLQMAMGRGGVVKAAQGLIAEFAPRPGGYYTPFGGRMVNFAEAGQSEVAAFLPRGLQGQQIIMKQLAPMFNIPTADIQVETRPQNNINIRVDHGDRHNIRAYNESSAGKVNKAVTVRK